VPVERRNSAAISSIGMNSTIEFDNPRFVDVFVLEIVLDFAILLDRTYGYTAVKD